MGDISDYFREQELNRHLNPSHFEDEFEEEFIDYNVWTTQKGDKIPVRSMTESHLINTINMLIRNNSQSEWVDTLELEMIRRGLTPPLHDECDATEIDIY